MEKIFTKLVKNGIVGAIQSVYVSPGMDEVSLNTVFFDISFLLIFNFDRIYELQQRNVCRAI